VPGESVGPKCWDSQFTCFTSTKVRVLTLTCLAGESGGPAFVFNGQGDEGSTNVTSTKVQILPQSCKYKSTNTDAWGEIKDVMGCTREEYLAMKLWKQNELRKKVGLFWELAGSHRVHIHRAVLQACIGSPRIAVYVRVEGERVGVAPGDLSLGFLSPCRQQEGAY
jgi:hypothetical protein